MSMNEWRALALLSILLHFLCICWTLWNSDYELAIYRGRMRMYISQGTPPEVYQSRHVSPLLGSNSESDSEEPQVVGQVQSMQENLLNLRSTFSPPPPPHKFNTTIDNQCWYMRINNYLHLKTMLKYTNLTDSQAYYILHKILRNIGTGTTRFVCIPKVFMIGGFPASGGTYLYDLLSQHSQVCGEVAKETNWQGKPELRAQFPHSILSILRYIQNYRPSSSYVEIEPQLLTIDASQSTILDQIECCSIPKILYSVLPQTKYIILMRDPIDRLMSDYVNLCQTSSQTRGSSIASLNRSSRRVRLFYEAALQAVKEFEVCAESRLLEVCVQESLSEVRTEGDDGNQTCGRVRLGISLYHVHIARWLRIIPRHRFLFLRMEDLASDTHLVLQDVWDFLGLPSHAQPLRTVDGLLSKLNSSREVYERGDGQNKLLAREKLKEFFSWHNEKLAQLLSDDKFLWK